MANSRVKPKKQRERLELRIAAFEKLSATDKVGCTKPGSQQK